MKLERLLIVGKQSKSVLDQHHLIMTDAQLRVHYAEQGIDPERIRLSAESQRISMAAVRATFPEAQVISFEELTPDRANAAEGIAFAGGDNHFQRGSHYVFGQTPVIGFNTDYRPGGSVGALLPFWVDHLASLRARLLTGAYEVEKWTRLEVLVRGQRVGLALCEVTWGETYFGHMSRGVFQILPGGQPISHKSNAPIIVTGSGSSGWYDAEWRVADRPPDYFPRTAREAHLLIRAPYLGLKSSDRPQTSFILREGEELHVTSQCDTAGVIDLDSREKPVIPFPQGAKAVIRLSDLPLHVVRMRGLDGLYEM